VQQSFAKRVEGIAVTTMPEGARARTKELWAMKAKLILFLCGSLLASSLSAQTFTPIRVNCGGPAYTDSKGNAWQADAHFEGGTANHWVGAVAGTSDPKLFWDVRYAPQGGYFVYRFAVPNGSYRVNLSFAEVWQSKPGRIFSVSINSVAVLSKFDVFAKVGRGAADIESIPVTVTDGRLTLELDTYAGNGFIDAIEILSDTLPPPPPQPYVHVMPGLGTATFSMQIPPACGPADGVCSITVEFCDAMTPPNCHTGNAGTLSLIKVVSLPTPQTQKIPVAVLKP
jgi:hypothetical protein